MPVGLVYHKGVGERTGGETEVSGSLVKSITSFAEAFSGAERVVVDVVLADVVLTDALLVDAERGIMLAGNMVCSMLRRKLAMFCIVMFCVSIAD